MSKVGRRTGRSAIDHFADAALEAIADAGLTCDDIDGLSTYPGRNNNSPGSAPMGCTEAREALGFKTNWHSSSAEGPAQMSPLMIAAMAVATGMARHVLCFRVLTESSSQTPERRASVPRGGGERISGWAQWFLPFNGLSASTWTAQMAIRHMHQYGTTREQIARQVLNQRDNAALNPRALFQTPLTHEEYFSARMITEPFGLYDCDIPIDGACVIIISALEAAKDLRKPPLRIEAMSAALSGRDSWDQRIDLSTMAATDVGPRLWERTDLRPKDIDVLGLYDGFSIYPLIWLEALGFCEMGQAGPFIADGHTARQGRYPVNTGGGQLSAGRLHGFGLLHENCVQLWGEAGKRQVEGARTAVCGMGGGPLAGAMILGRI